MTTVAVHPRRQVHVALRSVAGIVIGTSDQQLALSGEDPAIQALAIDDAAPRAIALQPRQSFGMAFQGQRQFTAIGGVAGRRGHVGEPGPAGGMAMQREAGETLSALVLVYEQGEQVFALDYRDEMHIDQLLGLTLTAAGNGEPINIQRFGSIDDSAWAWALGRVYLGAGGSLTQTPPDDGYQVLIGSAVSSTRLTLNITDPIELEA